MMGDYGGLTKNVSSPIMKPILLMLFLSTVFGYRNTKFRKPSFQRDSVEKVTNYPFQSEYQAVQARSSLDYDEYLYYSPHNRKSNLIDYVFRGFGSKKLPLRDAVESLPVQQLSAEERSLPPSERVPLRDAVEYRIDPDSVSTESNQDNFRSYDSDNGYNYEVNYDRFVEFDPSQHELLFQDQVYGYHNNDDWNRGREQYYYNDDTVEILPVDYSDGYFGRSNDFYGDENFFRENNYTGRYRTMRRMSWGRKSGEEISKVTYQQYKVVCYLEGWATYRRDPMKFNNLDIDPFACTHIIYAYAAIDPHTFGIFPQDEDHDIVQGGYRSIVGLKRYNPDLKVLISISGWTGGDSKFSIMASSAARRQKFIKSVARFVDTHNFDGVDLDWEYPGAEDLGGQINDKEHFSLLVEELSEVFRIKNWMLSASVAASRFRIEDGYDVRHISYYLDLLNVLAFDLHSERDEVADHHSPLYRRTHDQGLDVFYNADYAMQYWIKKGAPREKLILGIPFFGRTFTLSNPNHWKPGSEVAGPGKEGEFTQESGFIAYFEICRKFREGQWNFNLDSVGSPYMVKENQWIGYDDPSSVNNKLNYIKKQQLGGAALYAIDLDDFRGACGEKWPLLNTVRIGLAVRKPQPHPEVPLAPPQEIMVPVAGTIIVRPEDVNCTGQGYARDPNDCRVYYRCMWGSKTSYICPGNLHFDESLGLCNWPELSNCKTSPLSDEGDSNELFKSNIEDELRIVCYFTNWAWYRKGDGKYLPEHIDPSLCTHIVYAYGSLDPDELKIKPFDMMADVTHNFYDRVTSLPDPTKESGRAHVLLALGGWTDSTGDKYSRLVSDPVARREFIDNTVAFLKAFNFGGLHFDWNYPKCWQSDCNKGPDSDMSNFAIFIRDLNDAFKSENPPLTLAVGISGYREVIDVAYDVAKISDNVDFMSVMTYDYHGSWEKKTGHVSPLYYRPGDSFPRFNTNYTLEYLVSKGADRSKLLMGVPFYGQAYTLKNEIDNTYGAAAEGPGIPGEFTKQPGMLAYYEICDNVRRNMWMVSRDPQGSTGPYAFYADQWVSYDDVESIREKAKYVRSNRFGGIMAWTMDLDDFQNRCCRETYPLLKTIGRVFGRDYYPEPMQEDCTRPPAPITPAPPTMTTGIDSGASTEHVHTTWPTWTRPSTTQMTTANTPWWKPETTTKRPTTTRRPTTTMPPPPPTTTTTRRPTTTTTTTRRTTTKRPTTTRRPTMRPTTEMSTMKPVEMCEPGKYYPDPENCNAYYRCLLGELHKQYCLGGLHWNPVTNVCDWPESAQCDKDNFVQPSPAATTTSNPNEWWSTSTTAAPDEWWMTTTTRRPEEWWTTRPQMTDMPVWTTEESRPTMTTENFIEGCTNGNYYPHSTSCNLFYICVNGRLVTQNCAPGLHWNQDQQICDWSHNVPCPMAQNRPFTKVDPTKMTCEDGSYESYPGDCNKYLSCLWGKYAAFSCAPGLHWNNIQKVCDWPRNVNCDENLPTPIEEVPGENEIEDEFSQPIKQTTKRTTTTMRTTTSSWTTTMRTTTSRWTTTMRTTTPRRTTTTGHVSVTTVSPPSTSQSGYFKIVCYFTNWAWYRPGVGKYLPENIDPDLCTHIVYGFAVLDYSNLVIKAHDSWADFDNKFYERVVAYKKKGLKVTLAIGGWNDSLGDKYSRLVNSPSARRKFINHVIQFLQKYGFDGLDLDWEYPKCWQVDCKKGPDSDKAAFSAFVKELHDAFQPLGLLLSAAVSPSKTVVDAGYDVPALGQYLDWVAVMTYDYHGQWDKKTGHVAPMYLHEDDEFYFFNANYSINYWISEGVPRRKIVMGMPLYGQSFQLADAKINGLNAKAPGPGQAGEFTRAAGFLAYYEICDRINNRGWTVVKDEQKRMGPYAYKGNQWVSFDDVETIRMKSEYIRQMDLGGGMIWALDLDDFKNKCGGGRHPLLSTIREVLGPAPDGSSPMQTEMPSPGKPVGQIPSQAITKPAMTTKRPQGGKPHPQMTTRKPLGGLDLITTPMTQNEIVTSRPGTRSDMKVVCYFTNWAWYRQGLGKYLPSDIDPDLCTHIIYGFAVLNGDQGIIKPHDPWADFDNKFYEKVTDYKRKGIKVLVAIGGWNDSAGDKYSRLVNNPASRAKFIRHVLDFIEMHNFDGLDLDWEYPKCWQVNCQMGPDSDKPAFADFVRELKAAFKPKGLLLSAAVSPNKKVIDLGYDVPVMSENLDWISVMTYDYHGQWDKITGHVAPMYVHPEDSDVTFNANFSLNYWISQGADRKKIIMGMPMYGQSFSLANKDMNGLNAATYGGGEAGDFTRARGFLSYYEICHNIREKGWKVVRDPKGRMGPYAYLRDQWVSFDDQEMIMKKSQFIKDMGIGGGMIWALDLDDFRDRCGCEKYPLLKTINRVLRDYPGPGPACVLDGEEMQSVNPSTSLPMKPMRPTATKRPPMSQTHMTTTSRPFTSEIAPPMETSAPGNLPCNGMMYAEHSDCNKYYQCQHGMLHVMSCPAGLHWNKNHCDWPANSNCQGTSSNEVETIPAEISTPRPMTTKTPVKTERPTEWTTVQAVRPTTQETISNQPVLDSEYKVVCYFTNWAWYRPGIGKYTPENIDYELCTHIAYGFAVLDGNSLTIKPHDSWADLDNEFYIKVTNFKKKGLKVLIAIGGWNDSLGDKYSRLVRSPNSRRKFIDHVLQFIKKYNFDGLDLDWEYPKCWQVNCDSGPDEDKKNFATFVEELSRAFKPKGLLLSSAVSPSKVVIDLGYDVAKLSRYFDYISVMTYDFHGHWDKATGHVAPLYYYPGDTYDYFNANYSINYWIEKGADRKKIIMGMPLYGQSFQLKDPNEHGLNAPAYGPGQAGEFTRAGGFLAFYEICEYVKRQGYSVVRDPQGRMGPYAYRGNQWVSYDDVSEIRRKSQFVKDLGLGGGMVWALDLDDFRNRCGCGVHPLLKTLNQELRGIGGSFSDCT